MKPKIISLLSDFELDEEMPSRDDARIITTSSSPRGWHRLQQAAECMQKYSWKYNAPPPEPVLDANGQPEPPPPDDGLPRLHTSSPALVRGSLLHLMLAHRYKRMQWRQEGKDEEEWVEPLEAMELVAKFNKVPNAVIATLRHVYNVYDEAYESTERSMRILEVESLFEAQIAGKYLLTGRLDMVFEDLDSRVWAVDHKSAAFLKTATKEFYAVSGQLIGYQHLARQKYGAAFAGMKLNLVQVSDEPRFDFMTLQRSPNLEARFEQTVVDIEERIAALTATGRPYDEWPKAMNELTCYHRYGACDFIDQCRFGAGTQKSGNWAWTDDLTPNINGRS